MAGAAGNLYNGLHEYCEMLFALHFLRPVDLFVDVGAYVGSYTILASANCKARTIAFEPIPNSFSRLSRNVMVNDVKDKVQLINMAAGSTKKNIAFTNGP